MFAVNLQLYLQQANYLGKGKIDWYGYPGFPSNNQ